MTELKHRHKHFVAIDMGSNSFHLVIAREQDGSLQILHKEKKQVQLAQGLDENNNLSKEAIARGISCLKEFRLRFSELTETQVKPVATHTLRVANNAHDFLEQALDVFPYEIEIISGHEEARLIYSGIAHNQVLKPKNLIIDIGGGSTEVVIGKKITPTRLSSLKCGCVSYHERYFRTDELTKDNFKAAIIAADSELSTLSKDYLSGNWDLALGSSGSVKAVATALKEKYQFDHITLKSLKQLKADLIAAGHTSNITFENIDDRRKVLLPAAIAILISFFKRLNVKKLEFSPFALREGVLFELAKIGQYHDVQMRTVDSIARLYHIDMPHAGKVCNTAMELFEHVADEWQLRGFARLLLFASTLHEIGIHINSRQHHQHGGYIIQNSDLPGFSEPLQHQLSVLIRNHRKRPHLPSFDELDPELRKSTRYISSILRIAVLLNLGRVSLRFDFRDAKAIENKLFLTLPKNTKKNTLLINDLLREQKSIADLGIELHLL
ncbi:exopolyphosphatase [Shewanella sp. OPT22]|nr:exopolyphosphatase [Shewanella sp. OPT22]